MKLSDVAAGVLAAMLGLAVVLEALTFPGMPGQPIGPSMFPIVIGLGLIAAGAGLIVGRVRAPGLPSVELEDWARRPRAVASFALVVAALLFYAVAVNTLGFFFTATAFLSVLFLGFGVPRGRILPLALAVTLAVHYVFYTLLRVPLPWGVLEAIAW